MRKLIFPSSRIREQQNKTLPHLGYGIWFVLPRLKQTAYDWVKLSEQEKGKIIAERAEVDAKQSQLLKRNIEREILRQRRQQEQEAKVKRKEMMKVQFCIFVLIKTKLERSW